MELSAVLASAAVLGGIGVVLGVVIAVVNRRFWVWEDPRISEVEAMLPGSNCGACGLPGCRAFAENVVEGRIEPAGCTVMGAEEREAVAGHLGVEAGAADRRVARLLCAGGCDVAPRKAVYEGLGSCAAAVSTSGGGKACPWGCVGLADCAVACDFDAIVMTETELPAVIPELCTACGDCVEACPLDLFVLLPLEHHLLVQCRSALEGEAATDLCAVACDACGRCAVDAAEGLVEMRNGLPVIDDRLRDREDPSAVARCPTGAIRWVEGAQFPEAVRLQTSETR